jgi:predicted ferric reductase
MSQDLAPSTAARPSAVPRRRLRATPHWWRDAASTLAWASLAAVVLLWIAGGGISELTGPGALATSLGRVAGLLAADLMLVQIVMMARVPFIERSYGQDELARLHRLAGLTSFNLMLSHVVLILLGYAATARRGVLAEMWAVLTTYPGMLLALAAFAALVMVVVTSLRAARRRLRYESWHLLHLYAYLGAGLALPHQLWTGQEFVTHPLARVYWWSVWALALGAVLAYRVGLPLLRSWRHRLVVDRVVVEAPDVVSVHLRGRHLHRLPVRAGQFFSWRFLDGPGWTRAHPYSLSAAPSDDTLRITVREVDGTARLARLRPGTRVLVEGPYGRLTTERRTRRQVTLMAAGVGITPLRALLDELDPAPGDVTVIFRATDESGLILRHELEVIGRDRGVRLLWVLGPRVPDRVTWLPEQAKHLSDAEALLRLVPDVADHDLYLCGAGPWMDAAREAARAVGVPDHHIHLERFSW